MHPHLSLFLQDGNLIFTLHMHPALLADTEPGGIRATCISSDSYSVSVNYTNECRRETVVEASGMTCGILSTAPTMDLFECDLLHLL